ncbi:MAG: glycosyltransferase [Candidatus Anstonellaceae archaeon]
MRKVKFSLVIPAYNEEKRIKKTLPTLAKLGNLYEIIMICDGKDKTAEIAKKSRKPIKVLSYPFRLGKGKAIIEGFKNAKGEIVGFCDADQPALYKEFERLVKILKRKKEVDMVIGSRYIKGARVRISLKRKILSRIFNCLSETLFRFGIKDTQCGLKVMKKKALDSIIDDMKVVGWLFDIELIYKFKKRGFKILEAPIKWQETKGSKFSLEMLIDMFLSLIMFWLREERYK